MAGLDRPTGSCTDRHSGVPRGSSGGGGRVSQPGREWYVSVLAGGAAGEADSVSPDCGGRAPIAVAVAARIERVRAVSVWHHWRHGVSGSGNWFVRHILWMGFAACTGQGGQGARAWGAHRRCLAPHPTTREPPPLDVSIATRIMFPL